MLSRNSMIVTGSFIGTTTSSATMRICGTGSATRGVIAKARLPRTGAAICVRIVGAGRTVFGARGRWARHGLGASGETETMDFSDNGIARDPLGQFARDLTGAEPVVPELAQQFDTLVSPGH